MFAFLQLLPFLALVAFISIEVAADATPAITTFTQISEANATDGFAIESVVAFNQEGTVRLSGPGPELCSLADILASTCNIPAIGFDQGGAVNVTFTLPEASSLTVPPGVGLPSEYRVIPCYALADQVNRKWRKYDDSFKKDKSCLPFPDEPASLYVAGPVTKTLKLKDVAPNAHFSPQIYIRCSEQNPDKNKEWCHIVHRLTNKADPSIDKTEESFYKTEVLDSRPRNLYVAVFISCAVGPILLIAFLIYERGVLAKHV